MKSVYIFQVERYLLRQQIKKFGVSVHGRVLDVGAGSFDRYSQFIHCEEYIKMDIAEGPNVDIVGSADHIPFEDASFDSLISTQVFEHLTDPVKSAREAFRVLKSGGVMLLTVPQMNELHEEPHDYWRYTKFGIKKLFEGQGFVLTAMSQRGGFYTMIAQIITRYLIDRLHLYQHHFYGRISNKIFYVFGRMMMYLDTLDISTANRKNTLGWCAILKKP